MLEQFKLSIAKGFFYVLGYTPLIILHFLGTVLGSLVYCLPIKPRYYASRNIELCFPKLSFWQHQWFLLRALHDVAKAVLEAPVFWVRSQKHLVKLVHNKAGLDVVKQDIAAKKGAIILGAHMGGYYLKNAFIANYLPDTTYLYKPQKGILGTIMHDLRGRFGAKLVSTSREGVLALFRHLKKGGCVGMICDHNVLDNGNAWIPFFGISVPTMTLAAKLANKTKVPVYMVIMQRLSWGRGYRFNIWPVNEKIYSADEEAAVTCMNQELEKAIRQWPTQHEWLYRRFWDRPEGETKLYKTQIKQ